MNAHFASCVATFIAALAVAARGMCGPGPCHVRELQIEACEIPTISDEVRQRIVNEHERYAAMRGGKVDPLGRLHPDELEREARNIGVVLRVREIRSLEAPCSPETAARPPGNWVQPMQDNTTKQYFYTTEQYFYGGELPPTCDALSPGTTITVFESDCCDVIDGSFSCAMHLNAGSAVPAFLDAFLENRRAMDALKPLSK